MARSMSTALWCTAASSLTVKTKQGKDSRSPRKLLQVPSFPEFKMLKEVNKLAMESPRRSNHSWPLMTVSKDIFSTIALKRVRIQQEPSSKHFSRYWRSSEVIKNLSTTHYVTSTEFLKMPDQGSLILLKSWIILRTQSTWLRFWLVSCKMKVPQTIETEILLLIFWPFWLSLKRRRMKLIWKIPQTSLTGSNPERTSTIWNFHTTLLHLLWWQFWRKITWLETSQTSKDSNSWKIWSPDPASNKT